MMEPGLTCFLMISRSVSLSRFSTETAKTRLSVVFFHTAHNLDSIYKVPPIILPFAHFDFIYFHNDAFSTDNTFFGFQSICYKLTEIA
ncbi:Hypothetical protein SRAE_0000064700 [Strongyloides ratti]|uniref:Uncharacterized protein n=1 Tax=Strongyloides ratti TaxID=34506 RepID=A0A090KVI3_STRRB|nr:Hypothetical protein SRAE_0000064700 [Strongyloides ratti]CEF61525.1 Hypothetical protein SRAE_0000064700 [Strongyloides ratti]